MRNKTTEKVSAVDEPPPAPDGGGEAWTQALLGHLAVFMAWGYITTFGAFQTYYLTDLLPHSSPSALSWIGSVQTFLIFAVGAFAGRALDAGYFRITYTLGCFFLVFGIFMLSLCTYYWEVFLAQAVCSGLGAGLLFTPAMGLVATYFSSKRTFALAFVLCGAGTGGMVLPAIVSQLLYRIGFPWTLRIIGFILLALSAVTIAFFRTRLPPRSTGPLVEWTALRERPFMLFVAGMFLNFFPLYFAFFYVGTYGRQVLGLSYHTSVNLLIAVNGMGIPGRLIPAMISVKYTGPLNGIVPSCFVSALLLYCWAAIHSKGALYAFAITYGFFSNGVQGLWPGGLTSLTQDVTKTGARMGTAFTVVSLALLTGPPIGGALIQLDHGRYLYTQIWAGSSFVVGACLVIAARISKTGMKLKAVA